MNKLFTAFTGLVCLAFSAFGQGIVRNGVTTNSTTVSPANNDVLTYQTAHGKWTNSPLVATATNAIANMSGLGTNTTLRGLTSTIGMTNTGAFSNSSHVYVGGSGVFHGGVTNFGNATNSGTLGVGDVSTFSGNIDINSFGNVYMKATLGAIAAYITNDFSARSNSYFFGTNDFYKTVRFINVPTNTLLFNDGNTNLTGLTIGANLSISAGALVASGGASTNNPVQEVGRLSVTNNYVNTLKAAYGGTGGAFGHTNYLFATNGDSQFYNLFVGTNIVFVPLSGADSTNSPGVSVLFKQNATGGYYPTNGSRTIVVNTNPLAETWVSFSVTGGGSTNNFAPNIPITVSPLTNLNVMEYNLASGNWTNGASIGSGSVVRDVGALLQNISINGAVIYGQVDVSGGLTIKQFNLTNNIGIKVGTVAGVGGANTNFTLQAQGDESIIYVDAGTTNVNIVAIMQGDASFAHRGTLILTNRTGTARAFSLGAITNNWISLQQFDGITAPFTVTNSQAGRFDYEILGTNVQYSYKPMALPSN